MPYDPLLTMSALNLAVVSLHRITSSRDRLTLEREYTGIINNLRMGEINADPELTSLYQEIVRVIHRGRLRDDLKSEIDAVYSQDKQKSIKDIISGNFAKSYSSNVLLWLGKLAASCAVEYFKTKARAELQQDDQLLRLKSEELDEYSDLQRRLIGASWNLLRKYHLPDSYRLTQNGLDKFYAALQEGTPSKRKRMLKYIAGEFAMYPPYWYYCGMSALESGSHGDAGEYFRKFDDVWRPVLRRDTYKAEALKYRINVLVKPGINERNAGEIMNCLVEMRDNTELEDWANNIYMGMMYFALGHKDKAEECVMCNIDFGYESEVSGRVLAKFESETPPVKFAVPEKVPEHPAQNTEKLSVWGSFMKWLKPESMPVKVSPPQPVPQPVQEVTPKVDARYYRLLNVKTLRGKAEKGDSEAQYHLGLKCEKNAHGTGRPLNRDILTHEKHI